MFARAALTRNGLRPNVTSLPFQIKTLNFTTSSNKSISAKRKGNSSRSHKLKRCASLLKEEEIRAPSELGFFGSFFQEFKRTWAVGSELEMAERGDATAMFNLGVMYQNGYGVEQSYEKAFEYYEQSIEHGDGNGLGNLGFLYHRGLGVEQSYANAVEYYKRGAHLGDVRVMSDLGWMYYNGDGIEQCYETASEYFQQAMDLGDVTGMNSLGWMHHNGDGTFEQSYTQAKYYYKLAIAQEDDSPATLLAKADLEFLNDQNTGTSEQSHHHRNVREWYYNAALHQDADSMHKMSQAYAVGKGVIQSSTNANIWKAKYVEAISKQKKKADDKSQEDYIWKAKYVEAISKQKKKADDKSQEDLAADTTMVDTTMVDATVDATTVTDASDVKLDRQTRGTKQQERMLRRRNRKNEEQSLEIERTFVERFVDLFSGGNSGNNKYAEKKHRAKMYREKKRGKRTR